MGTAGGAAGGSLVNSRWVGSGYVRWVGGVPHFTTVTVTLTVRLTVGLSVEGRKGNSVSLLRNKRNTGTAQYLIIHFPWRETYTRRSV